MNIRKAILDDITRILPLYLDLMKQHGHYDMLYRIHGRARNEYRNFLKKAIKNRHALVLVAEDNKKIIAFLTCLIENRMPRFLIRKAAYLYDIYIRRGSRSRGIGKRLLRQAVIWAKRRKIRYIKLEVSPHNKKGFNFWQRQGFYIFQYKMVRRIR